MIDSLGHPTSALLVGGTSDLGRAIIGALVGDRDCRVVVAGRERDRTLDAATGLGDDVEFVHFDAHEPSTYESCVDAAWGDEGIDLVVVAHGLLGDNETAWTDAAAATETATVNYTSATAVLAECAERIRRQGHGTIIVLSSVAGERVRRPNFVYGAAKAGLDAFATGLRTALRPVGGRVIVVRPGFVHSRMTEGLDPAPFATTPEVVGARVADAVRAGRDDVWVPGILRWVMRVLRHLPASVFERLPG